MDDLALVAQLLQPDTGAGDATDRAARLDAGLSIWAVLRHHFPEQEGPYRHAIEALITRGRLDEAEPLLAEAMRRFAAAPWPHLVRVALARERGDLAEACAVADHAGQLFPAEPVRCRKDIALLRAKQRFAEAIARLEEARRWYPGDRWPLVDGAWIARQAQDSESALRFAELLRTQFPDEAAGYLVGLFSLRQTGRLDAAEAVLFEAVVRFPAADWPLIEGAWLAQRRAAWGDAVGRAAELRTRLPAEQAGYQIGAFALVQERRYAEAEAVLCQAMERIEPQQPWLMAEYARLAQRRGDWDEAERRWALFRARFPDQPEGFSGHADALRQAARLEQAEAVATEGVRRFPRSAEIAVAHARVAVDRRDWYVAFRRWQAARPRFPDRPEIAAGLGMALQFLRRLDEAEAALDEAKARFPHDHDVAIAHAGIAAARYNWPEAHRRWQAVLGRYPQNATAQVGLGVALRELGRLDEADQVLGDALRSFPTHQPLVFGYVWVAIKRRDWPEALRRCELIRERFGETDAYLRTRGYALATAQIDRLDAHLSAPEIDGMPDDAAMARPGPGAAADTSPADLLMRFESLGENCEFGFVQRHVGAEPLGLLRWASTPTQHLLTLLRTRFEGVGQPEFTQLYTEVNGEFWVMDPRYDLRTHTFVFEQGFSDEQKTRFQQQMAARFRFLRKKLLEDLEDGTKIFVLRSQDALPHETIEAVYAAVAAYGPNWLLHVRLADPLHAAGTLERLHDRLMVGYIATALPLDHAGWQQVCSNAHALVHSLAREVAGAA